MIAVALVVAAAWLATPVLAAGAPGPAGAPAAPESPAARARAALADLTAAFWIGTPTAGHLRMDAKEDKQEVGVWEQAQMISAYYGAWKYLGDAQAGQIVAAEWAWVQHRASTPADLAACGPGVKFNFGSDDTGWDVGFFLQAYDVTHDPTTLTAAAGALDCAWRTWWDGTLGGGYWYNNQHADKTMYQAVLTLDCEWLFRLTHEARFQQRAIASEQWTVSGLGRDDGLYWKGVHKDGKVPEGRYQIEPGRSVTMIQGNMAQAVAEMWLYQDTGKPMYLQRARQTASAILQYEVDRAGVLMPDQDAFVAGWAMVPFAHEVVRQLPPQQRASWAKTFQTSAAAIWQLDRRGDGTFGPDWGGPPQGGAWTFRRNAPTPASKVSVSGGPVNVIVAAAIQ
jgi:hypothetical protein